MSSEVVSLREQRDALKREIDLRVRVYPTKIKMGQLTQEVADRAIAVLRAALATIESTTKPEKAKDDPLLKIEPILHHVHTCASHTKSKCESCLAIAQLLEDSLGFVRPKK